MNEDARMETARKLLAHHLDDRGRLKLLPAKRKTKIAALYYLSTKLEKGKSYTEAELNDRLDAWSLFHDPATLRREMYNLRLLDREPHGRAYWLEAEAPALPELDADKA